MIWVSVKQHLLKIHDFVLRRLPDKVAINLSYFRFFRTLPNLKDPQTFNEKINWRKLHQRDPRFSLFADKILVKNEIVKLIGEDHVIPTLWSGSNPDEIPFEILEPPYVIKVNHGYSSNIFVQSKEDVDQAKICRKLYKNLKLVHGDVTKEWAYLGIKRQVLVEKMIFDDVGQIPIDYKFQVYHGRVQYILCIPSRFEGKRGSWFDTHWNRQPFSSLLPDIDNPQLYKPDDLSEMIEIAEKIGSLFDYVRVDLYSTKEGIFFGETTFYPGAGYNRIRPDSGDYLLGEPWKNKAY